VQHNAWYPGLVSVIRIVCCWCSAFWMFTMSERGEPLGFYVLPYVVFGVIVFAFFRWLLRKPRALPLLAAAGAALWVLGSVVLLRRFSTISGFGALTFGVISVLTVVIFAVRDCMDPPAAMKNISGLEITTLFFLFYLFVQYVFGWPVTYSLPLLTAVVLSLTAVIHQRISNVGSSDSRGRIRSIAAAGGMLAIALAVAALFLAFGAEPLGKSVLTLYYGIVFCLKLLWRLVNAVLYWLMSLVPETQGEMLAEPAPEMIITEEMMEETQLPLWVLILLGSVAICAALAAVIYLIFRLRKLRLGGKTAPRVGTAVERKRPSVRRWLRRLMEPLKSRLRILYATVVMRGTPQALYLYLKRAGRRLDCGQLPGETPCAFVRRAASATAAENETDLSKAMEELARALGACLYAPVAPPPLPGEIGRCIHREFGRALRKARREQMKKWLAEKFADKKNGVAELP